MLQQRSTKVRADGYNFPKSGFLVYSSALFTNLNESRVIVMMTTDAIIPAIVMPLVFGPKVGS